MANVDGAFGFRPIGTSNGGTYSGNLVTCAIPANNGTATFVGDAVALTTAGITVRDATYPGVVQATAGSPVFGVIVGFEPDRTDLTRQYRVASTERLCRVVPVTDAFFVAQEDSVGGALALADMGQQVDIVVAAGNTATGTSGMEIDSSSTGTNAQALLVGFWNAPDNEIGDNAQWIVKFVETQLGTTAPAGV